MVPQRVASCKYHPEILSTSWNRYLPANQMNRLLSEYTGLNLYRGFKSLPLRHISNKNGELLRKVARRFIVWNGYIGTDARPNTYRRTYFCLKPILSSPNLYQLRLTLKCWALFNVILYLKVNKFHSTFFIFCQSLVSNRVIPFHFSELQSLPSLVVQTPPVQAQEHHTRRRPRSTWHSTFRSQDQLYKLVQS